MEPLKQATHRKWKLQEDDRASTVNFTDRILNVKAGVETVIFGTVFVDSPMKPNVLQDLESDVSVDHTSHAP